MAMLQSCDTLGTITQSPRSLALTGHVEDGEPLQVTDRKLLQGKDTRLKTDPKALTDVHYKNRFWGMRGGGGCFVTQGMI